ncbi:MAG TPA: TPM domain-containing protein [Usitatibacteraceae bacterium]|nr:TPM domain-containing protein [Usitatibacteraceae bacterium]
MDLRRFWRHIAMTPWKAARAFPPSARGAIGRAVAEHEKQHRGEIRFVVEAELTSAQLWANLGARARAVELFAMLHVWDTAENTGVLVYVLLADRKVEIVADRGISARVAQAEWQAICASMQEAFRAGRFAEGAVEGVTAISALLERHFPAEAANANELPDQPVML